MRRLSENELSGLRKILIIQLGPFGDALLTTSYFETLKKRLPDARLHYLVKQPYDKAIRDHPLIDRVMTIRKRGGLGYVIERLRTIHAIRSEGFDLVIDQQNKPSSQQLTFLSGARYRLGYADARFSWAYNLKAGRGPLRYSASRKYDILGPLGIEEEEYAVYLHIPSEAVRTADKWLREAGLDRAGVVCISPGSPVRKKRWKPANFARLADLIQTRTGCRVVLLWGPGETETVEIVRSRMQTEPAVAPPTDLRQVGAFLKRCRLLICNDGGLNHIAVTTSTTTIAIFGNTDPVVWSPASTFKHHYHFHKPGFESMKDDSFGVSPEEVFGKVEEVLTTRVRQT